MTAGRTRTLRLTVAAVTLGVCGSVLAADVVTSRGLIGAAPHAKSPALPAEIGVGGPLPAKVTAQPGGRVIAAYLDDNDDEGWWVLVGADRATYRRIDATLRREDAIASAVLSPDGRLVATTGRVPAGPVSIVDVGSGGRRNLPGLELQDDDGVLAWSRDNSQLALRLAGKLATVAVADGKVTRYDVAAIAAVFDPTGALVAASSGSVMSIAGGADVQTYEVPGYRVAAAGWSPDGTKLAVQSAARYDGPPFGWIDLLTGRLTRAMGMTDGVAALAWRGNDVVIGTNHRDVSAYDIRAGTRTQLSALSAWGTTGLQLASGLVGDAPVVPRGRIDRGHPRMWYAALAVVILAMAAVGLWWPRPGSPRRAGPGFVNALALRDLAISVFGLLGVIVLGVMVPLTFLEQPDLAPQYGSVGALGAATLIAALLLRPGNAPAAVGAATRTPAGAAV